MIQQLYWRLSAELFQMERVAHSQHYRHPAKQTELALTFAAPDHQGDEAPLSWGIYRNIPFALLGILVIVLFYRSAKEHGDRAFGWMWLTIVLSFSFYIPVGNNGCEPQRAWSCR